MCVTKKSTSPIYMCYRIPLSNGAWGRGGGGVLWKIEILGRGNPEEIEIWRGQSKLVQILVDIVALCVPYTLIFSHEIDCLLSLYLELFHVLWCRLNCFFLPVY